MKFSSLSLLFLTLLDVSATQIGSSSRNLTKLDSTCTATIATEEFEEKDGKTILYCLLDSGLSYQVDVPPGFIKKNFDEGPFIPNKTRLIFESEPMVDKSTDKIVYTGKPKLQAIEGPMVAALPTLGDYSVLVVRVIAANDSTTASPAFLGNSVFGDAGDPVNLKSQYSECSHDQINIIKADDRTGSSTNISNGVVEVTVSTNTSQGDGVMRNAITAELNSQFGVSSPSQLADLVMYCMPPGTMSGIAYAYINSWNSVYSDYWCTYVSAQMHEIGHNVGLAHSNEGGEYQDQSGMMGYSYGSSDTPVMCFNAPKMWQLGWYTSKQEVVSATPGERQYSGELAGLMEDYYDPTVPTMLVKLNSNTADDYFIFFNRVAGFNSGTQEGGNTVMIASTGAEGLAYSPSELRAKLGSGDSWTSPTVFNGEAITVTVNSIGTRADVDICVGVCGVTPAPTPSPTSAPTITPQPTGDCFDLDIEILPDTWAPGETSWRVLDVDGVTVIDSGGLSDFTAYVLYEYTVECLQTTCGTDDSYTFEIIDDYGDGLNWSTTDPGYFKVFVKGTELFGSSDGVNFGSGDTVVVEDICDSTPTVSPTSSPTTMTPTVSPTPAPSSAPSVAPTFTCTDSIYALAYTQVAGGTAIPCEFVKDFVSDCLCDDADVRSHCPVTCESCEERGCSDSIATFYTPLGVAGSCALLATFPPGDVSAYCLSPDVSATCPETCGVCP